MSEPGPSEALVLSSPGAKRGETLWTRLQHLYERRETILFLVSSNLKSGHRDKVLGHLWSLLDPLLFMLVYFLVFGVLFGQVRGGRSGEFMIYLFVGILAWRFLDGAVAQSVNCMRSNRGLIHEINFPKAIFPVSICLSRLYDFVWGLVVLLGVLLLFGGAHGFPSLHLAWLPVLIFLHVLFTLGLTFVVAYLGAFFADTVNVLSVAMRLWFYASPVFYYVSGERSIIPEAYRHLRSYYMLNPMAGFFESYRDALLWARTPELSSLLYVALVSGVTFVVGFAVFSNGEGKFAKYV